VQARLGVAAAVALLGPRQVGKTTLARDLAEQWPAGAVYLDLERPGDLRRLEDADTFLRAQAPQLVVIDEVHRVPDLFAVLRGVIDDNRRSGFRTGQFLLLGSASLDLIQMSSESLAGRISHCDLGGVNVDEAASVSISEDQLWVRGGFPESLMAGDDSIAMQWRGDLLRSYLERDVPMFAPRIPAATLRRLWTMLAHSTGGLFNASRLAENLAVSGPTVTRYVDLLVDLGLVRRLDPWHVNIGKRVTRSPKIHVRDSGLTHALLDIPDLHALLGHPVVGASYESFTVESLIGAATDAQPFHYRTARGDEVDLVLVQGGEPRVAIEVKRSSAPTLSAGFHRACDDLGVTHRYLVHPSTGSPPYVTSGGVMVIGLGELVERLRPASEDPG
jgi:predicted AAA+ superfamily ATPase